MIRPEAGPVSPAAVTTPVAETALDARTMQELAVVIAAFGLTMVLGLLASRRRILVAADGTD